MAEGYLVLVALDFETSPCPTNWLCRWFLAQNQHFFCHFLPGGMKDQPQLTQPPHRTAFEVDPGSPFLANWKQQGSVETDFDPVRWKLINFMVFPTDHLAVDRTCLYCSCVAVRPNFTKAIMMGPIGSRAGSPISSSKSLALVPELFVAFPEIVNYCDCRFIDHNWST